MPAHKFHRCEREPPSGQPQRRMVEYGRCGNPDECPMTAAAFDNRMRSPAPPRLQGDIGRWVPGGTVPWVEGQNA